LEISEICGPDNSFWRQSTQMLRPCKARILDWTSGFLLDLSGTQMSWRIRWRESGKVAACRKFIKRKVYKSTTKKYYAQH
jgi:hypothetical protein